MKFLTWFPRILATLFGVVVLIVVISFSLSNRQRVSLDLWPFEASLELHLILLLGCIFLTGFLAGAVVMWFSGGSTRRKAREARRDASQLERQVAALESRSQKTDTEKSLTVATSGH